MNSQKGPTQSSEKPSKTSFSLNQANMLMRFIELGQSDCILWELIYHSKVEHVPIDKITGLNVTLEVDTRMDLLRVFI